MATYRIVKNGDVLQVGFDQPAQNDEICREAYRLLEQMHTSGELAGGPLIKINGPASLPVAVVLGHALIHLYGAVAVFDPKLGRYVVAASHNPDFQVGDLID